MSQHQVVDGSLCEHQRCRSLGDRFYWRFYNQLSVDLRQRLAWSALEELHKQLQAPFYDQLFRQLSTYVNWQLEKDLK